MAKPTGWNRFMAALAGEVPAAELEAYRRASGPVFELMEQVERRRLECKIDGLDPWMVPAATRAAFLCAWNAFVLQTLGNELLEADYRTEPRTHGHVPPATAAQVLRFFGEVDGWVSRAWQAQANPDYRLGVPVPAKLPGWEPLKPMPRAYLQGLLHAMRSVRDHAAAAMEFLPAVPPEESERQGELNRIRQLYASAQVRARYADELSAHDEVPPVHDRAAEHARAALEEFHLLGQLIADPDLADGRPAPAKTGPTPALPARKQAARLAPGTQPAAEPSASAKPASATSVERAPSRQASESTAPAVPPSPAPATADATKVVRPPARRGKDGTRGKAAAKAKEPAAPRTGLVTRHDRFKGQTITESAESVAFTGRLLHDTDFELRPTLVRTKDGEAVVLRVDARSFGGLPSLTSGTLTVHADGANTELRPLADKKTRVVQEKGRARFEEHVGYELPRGLLEKLCEARSAGLLFDTHQTSLDVDAEAVERIQACCRAFRVALG